MYVIVTFDLEGAGDDQYQLAYDILAELGLHVASPHKQVDLPSTTVLGQYRDLNMTAAEIQSTIWALFTRAGLKPRRMFGAVLSDWATKSAG